MTTAACAFDSIARRYAELWDNTAIGRFQREAVWRHIDRLFKRGDRVLDIGCGTGVDALHLNSLGVDIRGVDASAEMIKIARAHGVSAEQLAAEHLDEVEQQFDGALSNFGVLNCGLDLRKFACDLSAVIRNEGYVAVCVMGRLCAWEIFYFLLHGDISKAFRRFQPATPSSIGVEVRYPRTRELIAAFQPHFELRASYGIGIFVPPSYVRRVALVVSALAYIDKLICRVPGFRSAGDHKLYIFQRV